MATPLNFAKTCTACFRKIVKEHQEIVAKTPVKIKMRGLFARALSVFILIYYWQSVWELL